MAIRVQKTAMTHRNNGSKIKNAPMKRTATKRSSNAKSKRTATRIYK